MPKQPSDWVHAAKEPPGHGWHQNLLIEFHDDSHVELFNLREDIGESRDIASDQPETVNHLRSRLQAWREEVGAQMPVPNPSHDPARPQYDPKRPQPLAGERPMPRYKQHSALFLDNTQRQPND